MRDWFDGLFTGIFSVIAIGVLFWYLNYIHVFGGGRLICLW